MERKTVLIFQVTSFIRENLDIAKKWKLYKRNWIASNTNTKQRHKDYVKAEIDKIQQNGKCRLCCETDEMIHHVISESSKLAKKEYRTRHNRVGRWSVGNCARNWNLNIQPESIPENETHKIILDSKIQIDDLMPARKPDLIIVNKYENLPKSGLCRPGGPQSENQRKWKERQIPVSCQRT